MNIHQIISELSHYEKGVLPTKALLSAKENWSEIRNHVTERLEKYLENDTKVSEEDSIFLLFGTMLIADVKDTVLTPLLIQFLDQDDDIGSNLDSILGDGLTDSLPSMLFDLTQDNYQQLVPLINVQKPGQWVKSSAIRSMFTIYRADKVTRLELCELVDKWIAEFTHVDEDFQELAEYLMATLVDECIKHDLDEYKDKFIDCFEAGLIDQQSFNIKYVQNWTVFRRPTDTPDKFDVIQELGSWHSFTPETELKRRDAECKARYQSSIREITNQKTPSQYQEPYVAEKKPGRNEPCHCGSGKKYKKCCMP